MKTDEEMIQDAIAEMGSEYTEQEKKSHEEILRKIIIENLPLKEAFSLNPEIMETIYDHGYRQYLSGKYREAGTLFSMLVTFDPFNTKYLMSSAATLQMEKNYIDALKIYAGCIALDPNNVLAHYYSADCFQKLGDIPEAIIFLRYTQYLCDLYPDKFNVIKERAHMLEEHLKEELNDWMQKQEAQKDSEK